MIFQVFHFSTTVIPRISNHRWVSITFLTCGMIFTKGAYFKHRACLVLIRWTCLVRKASAHLQSLFTSTWAALLISFHQKSKSVKSDMVSDTNTAVSLFEFLIILQVYVLPSSLVIVHTYTWLINSACC